MKTLFLDIMIGEKYDRYYCTLKYKFWPQVSFSETELVEFVIGKCPSLKNKQFRIITV